MIVRKMKVIRREANISIEELALYAKVTEYQISSFENLIVNLNGQALKAIARKLKTTVRELKKPCEVERSSNNRRSCKYKLIRENVTKEEAAIAAAMERERKREIGRKFAEKEKAKKREPKKLEIKPGKPFECRNEKCLLNSSNTKGCGGQKCMCDSPVVTGGYGACDNMNVKKEKQEQHLSWRNTKACFAANTIDMEKRGIHR